MASGTSLQGRSDVLTGARGMLARRPQVQNFFTVIDHLRAIDAFVM